MRTEDVLNQIGEALDDWEVGPDAMRCGAPVPGPGEQLIDDSYWERCRAGAAAQRSAFGQAHIVVGFDGSREDDAVVAAYAMGPGRMWVLPPEPTSPWRGADLNPLVRAVAEFIEQFITNFALSPWQVAWIERIYGALEQTPERVGPEPLCIDGHAYRRRQRNRRRR